MLRAERRKLDSIWTTRALWLAAVVVVLAGDFTTVSSAEVDTLSGPLRDQPFHTLTSVNLSLFAVLVGVRSITDEYRYRTISWTLLARQDRARALAAKAFVAGCYGMVIGLTAQSIGISAALLTIGSRGGHLDLDRGDAAAVAGLALASAIWAVLGVAVGSLVRNQVVAVSVAIVWVLAIENLGSAFLGTAGRFLPGQAAHGLALVGGIDGLPPLMALGLLGIYVALFGAVAAYLFDRRALSSAG